MSLNARRELAAVVASRYQTTSKTGKSRILDEFVEATGFHRKYAICVLQHPTVSRPAASRKSAPRVRRRKYGPDVEHAFLALWRVSGGLCPKRLVPFLMQLIEALERFEEITLCSCVKDKLLGMSIATAERMLERLRRSHDRGMSTTSPGTLLRQQIPIRTYEDWTENRPGFMEVDLVAHCGGTASGDYLYTLTMTDICTGWTECVAVANRSQIAVQEGIDQIRRRLPFPLLGIDSDNGAEFINHHLKRYCDAHQITFTRCRPYKKNDQCHVEQKNGSVVRPLVGYARYEGAEAAAHLNRLYSLDRLSLNFFKPSMKLIGKSRNGSRVKKTYDAAKTPWQRLGGTNLLTKEAAEKRHQQYLLLNPAKLRRDIEELEMGLRHFTIGSSALPAYPANSSPDLPDITVERLRNVTIEKGDHHGPTA